MTTVAQVVTRSLRLLQVVDAQEAPTATDYETAQIALNAMMTRWEATGLAMGWQNVDNPSDTLPAPPEAEEAITYQLALRLAPEYGLTPSGLVVAAAQQFMNDVLRDRLVEMPLRQMPVLPISRSSGWYGWWG